MFQCMWELNGKLKQGYINPLLWMKFNKDGYSGITNHIQEICMTNFSRCSGEFQILEIIFPYFWTRKILVLIYYRYNIVRLKEFKSVLHTY